MEIREVVRKARSRRPGWFQVGALLHVKIRGMLRTTGGGGGGEGTQV